MDAHSRRRTALDAINDVLGGAVAGDCETEVVDFKEEAGTVDHPGKRVPISPRHEPAAQLLAVEVACMAMSDSGGILVVGVNDRAAGPDAFVGGHLDLEWLRRRIHALTQPNLALDVFEERVEAGARIYLINVQPALEEVRVGGKLRARHGTDCIELSGDRAREFLERRRRYDWSAEPSGMTLSQADPAALRRALELYRAARGRRAGSDLDLAGRLAVALDDSNDPALSRAGALLLCRYEPDVEQLDVRVVRVEGARSTVRKILTAPMVLSFDQAWTVIDHAFVEDSIVVGATRRSTRTIPEEALREALVNAIMHRDYRMPRTPIVALSIGDPAITLKVTSPGDFPPEVDGARLLAARSEPRNRALADAMRLLGYAEREGNGIPTMFRVLLRDGHPEPDIYAEGGDIVCRLPGGQLDTHVRRFFDQLYVRDQDMEEDVRAHIAVIELLSRTPLRVERLSERAQCSAGEAFETLTTMAADGVVERLLDGSRSFRLTPSARQSLQSRIEYSRRQSIDHAWDLIRAYLDVESTIGRNDAARLLGVTDVQASRTLSKLYNDHDVLKPVGSARGRGVRYELATQ
jgi:ATP-dependent DNA helicase RecG